MKIIQAHKFYWQRDGASNYALYLSALLKGENHTVIPFATKQSESLDTPYKKYFPTYYDLSSPKKLSFLKKVKAVTNIFYSFEAKRKFAALLKKEKDVDVLHIHNIYHHISPSILAVAKQHGLKIVMTLHDYKLLSPNYSLFHHGRIHEDDANGLYLSCIKNKCVKNSRVQSVVSTAEMILHHKIMKYYKRYVDVFIAPSQFMIDMCVRHGWDRKKFIHIRHPINTKTYKPSKDNGEYVTYIGRLSEEKGLDVLLSAAKNTPNIQYRIVGTGPLELMLKAKIKKQGLSHVQMMGFKTGASLKKIIEQSSMLVLPSVWYENYPLSILEAKASGKIVIGSNIGGIPEMLPKSMLAKSGDPGDLAKKIISWNNKATFEKQKWGRVLRSQVEEVNDPKKHMKEMLSVYSR